jgi:elongator complex protein 5
MNSTSATYAFLSKIRNFPSARLIIHTLHPSPTSPTGSLLPLLTQTSFSPSLTHIITHPTSLLLHISSHYLCPPPPLSTPQKFWSIFTPMSQRHSETDKLIFGVNNNNEFAVELLVRSGSTDNGRARKRTVNRTLQGWDPRRGLCELHDLRSMQSLWSSNKSNAEKVCLDSLSFSLFFLSSFPSSSSLLLLWIIDQPLAPRPPPPLIRQISSLSTSTLRLLSRQHERKSLCLTHIKVGYLFACTILSRLYTHSFAGNDLSVDNSSSGAIFYDPDSADDIDDDDPDEDLDI